MNEEQPHRFLKYLLPSIAQFVCDGLTRQKLREAPKGPAGLYASILACFTEAFLFLLFFSFPKHLSLYRQGSQRPLQPRTNEKENPRSC